eukprot:5248298-Lingulodinium_polyedra.AAC.1
MPRARGRNFKAVGTRQAFRAASGRSRTSGPRASRPLQGPRAAASPLVSLRRAAPAGASGRP